MMTAKTKTMAAIITTIVGTGVALAALTTPWAWVLAHHEALRNLALVAAGAIAVPLAIWRAWVAANLSKADLSGANLSRVILSEANSRQAQLLLKNNLTRPSPYPPKSLRSSWATSAMLKRRLP